jgi:opacity protein-like surface antigen
LGAVCDAEGELCYCLGCLKIGMDNKKHFCERGGCGRPFSYDQGEPAMTRQKKTTAVLLGLCLTVCAGLASAQTPPDTQTITRGVYLGAALGQSEAKEYDCTALPQCENHGTVGRFLVGLQFGRHWSFELSLTDLGKIDSASPGTFTQTVKVRLAETDLLASYPVTGRFMIYGKGGLYYAQTTQDTTLSGVSSRITESNGGVTWGGGLQYYITGGLAVRGEAQRYMKVGGGDIGDGDYNAYTIGLLYKMR